MQRLSAEDLEGLKLVGSGGFGRVFKGRSKKLGMDIAVKIMDKHICISAEFDSLMKEKDMMMKANSTFVLRVLASYEQEDKGHTVYGLVMEYMPHGSLHSLFNTFNEKKALVPWALRFQMLHQISLAMNFLHGLDPAIIHRDLKPQNVLLRKDLDVQLTDFGLARNENSVSIGMMGTVSYMPPESFCTEYKQTKEFDVYSFSILIWSILSGQEPYNGINRQIIMYRIPLGTRPDEKIVDCWRAEKMVPEAIEMMKQCWHHNPSSRPCFADCMKRLEKMKKAYDGEIDNAVFEVLKKLRNYSSSTQNNQVADIPDSVNKVETGLSDINSSKMTNFIDRLNLESLAEEDNETASTNTFKDEIDTMDAVGFLKNNFYEIIKQKPDWDYILDDLYTKCIFTQEQVDIVKCHRKVQDQIRETLHIVMKQGQRSCRTLVQLMNHHNPSLMRKLAN